MEIRSVFLPRWAAGWAAVSVPPRWMVWFVRCCLRKLLCTESFFSGRPHFSFQFFQIHRFDTEMLDQVYAVTLLTKERVSNVVVMGMGEPLDNYDHLLKFIRLLTDANVQN